MQVKIFQEASIDAALCLFDLIENEMIAALDDIENQIEIDSFFLQNGLNEDEPSSYLILILDFHNWLNNKPSNITGLSAIANSYSHLNTISHEDQYFKQK